MAAIYINVLKNITPNRLYSADVMSKLATTLRMLATKLTTGEILDKWSWVQAENDKIQSLLSLKTSADEKFKARNFKGALLAYSNAIKVREWYGVCSGTRNICTDAFTRRLLEAFLVPLKSSLFVCFVSIVKPFVHIPKMFTAPQLHHHINNN